MRNAGAASVGVGVQGSIRTTLLWWTMWIIWIPLFVPNIVDLVKSQPFSIGIAASLLGAALFFVLYGSMSWQCARRLSADRLADRPTGRTLWVPVGAMLALAVVLTLVVGPAWGSLFIYSSSCVAGWLPLRPAVALILGMVVFTMVGLFFGDESSAQFTSAIVFIIVPGFVVIAFTQSVTAAHQARVAQEEMARLSAVTEERLRIARDLHDLLGHTLSIITLKSELAGRLVNVAPERASAEIADVERVARTALREVREAVSGYRRATLAGELAGVREVLAAAGIAYATVGDQRASRDLPPAVDSALAWAVREGVTNVIRHSGASSCSVRVTRGADDVRVEILDDGVAPTTARDTTGDEASGNGLRGLAERAQALGGTCEFGPRPNGGFCLSVCIPCTPPDVPEATSSDTAVASNAGRVGDASAPVAAEERA